MLWHTASLAQRLWAKRPFDVIHACNPPDLFFLIGRMYRPRGVSFVFDQHDASPEIMIAKRGGREHEGFPERVVRWAERNTYRLADVVISPNESYRRLALTRGGKLAQDVFVVRSGPRREEFSPVSEGAFDRRGHRHLVAYLGVMGAQDGVDLLVQAVARLVREGRDILLYLAGDGESYATIRHLGEELGLGARLLMPGYQTAEEFAPALLAADVCVTPDPSSPFNDISTMNKIVEYMAMGRASVAFPLPENVATGGDAVAYADDLSHEGLAAAIGRLLDDEEERRRMGARARERFETVLAWEHQAPGLLAAYERLRVKVGGRGARDARRPGDTPGACALSDGRSAAAARRPLPRSREPRPLHLVGALLAPHRDAGRGVRSRGALRADAVAEAPVDGASEVPVAGGRDGGRAGGRRAGGGVGHGPPAPGGRSRRGRRTGTPRPSGRRHAHRRLLRSRVASSAAARAPAAAPRHGGRRHQRVAGRTGAVVGRAGIRAAGPPAGGARRARARGRRARSRHRRRDVLAG